MRKVTRSCALAAGLCTLLALPGSATAAVSTDQPSYAPGSTVTISGDNSDGAGYAPADSVKVAVSGPGGKATSCSAVANISGAWSCQVTLASDSSAIGSYSYTATGQISGVSQSGSFTDSGCPDSNSLESHKNEDPKLSASYTTTGGKATYFFKSSNESPVGGIPGLIEYCVYTSPLPDETEALYSNSEGAWTTGSGGGFFDFERSDGNADNVPFDGSTQTMGTATWTSGQVPANQTILLHINDTTECTNLEGKATETCFVRPVVCHTLVGVGHYGPKGKAGQNLNNNLNTCPGAATKEVFETTWENGTKHIRLVHVNSASAVINGSEVKFSGQGTATLNKEKGYEITFTFTRAAGKWNLFLVLEKSNVVIQEFHLEPLNSSTKETFS